MDILTFTILCLLIFCLIGLTFYRSRIAAPSYNIASWLIIIILFGFATNSPDWYTYENAYYHNIIYEPFFNVIRDVARYFNLPYERIHQTYIILSSTCLFILILKFKKNTLPILLFYIPTVAVYYVTQLRFSLGFFFILLAFYSLIVRDNKYSFTFLFILGLINHYSLILFLPLAFIPLNNINLFRKGIFVFSIGLLFVFTSLSLLLAEYIPKYQIYFVPEKQTTFLGALFIFAPYIVIQFFILYFVRKRFRIEEWFYDKKVKYLYIINSFLLALLPSSFVFQIIGKRFLFFGFIIQILLIVYFSKKTKIKGYLVYILLLSFLIFHIYYLYFLPNSFGLDQRVNQLVLILNSNKIIQFSL